MEEELAKLLVQVCAADDPHDKLILHPRLTRKRIRQPMGQSTGSKGKKPTVQDPHTDNDGRVRPKAQTMELSPGGTPAPSASKLQLPTGLQQTDADLSSQAGNKESVSPHMRMSHFGRVMLYHRATKCRLKAPCSTHSSQRALNAK